MVSRYISIHVSKAIGKARELGAHAARPENQWLWGLSKRELVEIVLHLAAVSCDVGYDEAIKSDAAQQRAHDEMNNLIAAGML